MISLLRGKVAERQPGRVVVDVSGVGYEVAVPVETYSRLARSDSQVSLHVHTHVRENTLALFGFDQHRDKDLFERFLSVNGVGPQLALALLSGLTAPELIAAIRDGDYRRLVRVPGVGKKTAQRIILDLQGKVDGLADDAASPESGSHAVEEEVVSALVNLGCSPTAARRGVRKARRKGTPAEFETLFRNAMASMKR